MGEIFSVTGRKIVPEVHFNCPEPGCSGILRRRYSSKYSRYFYGCTEHFNTGCKGGIGCHPDGRPLGIPASSEVRELRKKAHMSFDRIWKNGNMPRSKAYEIFADRMKLSELHIGELDKEGCMKLIREVRKFWRFG